MLYVVRAGSHCKIGITRDLPRRVTELQVGSAHELEVLLAIPGGAEDERWVHERFALYRVRGEWFFAAKPLLEWVEAARQTRSIR